MGGIYLSVRIDPYSPYKRISDRVLTIANQSSVQRTAYDRLSKNFRGVEKFSEKEQLEIMERSALEVVIQASELLSAVRDELRRCSS